MTDIKKKVIDKLNDKKPIYRVGCEFFIRAENKEEAINFVAEELAYENFLERHISIEESDCEEADIFGEAE